ncbi:trypsin-like peptidase domain-containing protein [Thalassoroseus pseudoceratinae]|uniref:trypsin-like peptidase domain-containing protein n=1 Tax=Thalassoroseus pseudoceratinae TaxID=2713176 RepID=UPI00142393CE|nr:trypsin-like peptidase domain-containing protein [Thalassoroseus pseudoceratinae]
MTHLHFSKTIASLFCVHVALIMLGTSVCHAEDLEEAEEKAFREAAALAEPSIVRIQTVGGLDRVGQILAAEGPTTGVVVSSDGFVITSSFNFVNQPTSIVVRHPDGRPLPAKIVATDHSKMLTLLKVDADDLTPAVTAPAEEIRVGQWALAMGRTFDENLPSVSVGIVSALDRIWGKAIQTDAKTSPVNYGGPLVDIQGRVMGVVVPLSPQGTDEAAGVEWYDGGIGFAIPLADINRVLDRMKKGEDLHRGLLGVSFPGASGLLGVDPTIDRVRVNSPADKAGIESGDVLVKIGDTDVASQSEIKHAMGKYYAGDRLSITVKRGEENISADIELVAELAPYESGFLGILPERQSSENAEGVGVRYVFLDSPAAKLGLKNRDRIVAFDKTETPNAEVLLDLVSRMQPGDTASVTWSSEGKPNTKEVELAAIPDQLPDELRSVAIVPAGDAVERPEVGHFSGTIPDGEMTYWAYVPDGYNPAASYGLMVWIHPNDDTMEAAILNKWRVICEQRGLILLAPRAENITRWTLPETAVVKQLVEKFLADYSIDQDRVFVHTMAEGGPFGLQLVLKNRDLFAGFSGVGTPLRGKLPENDPDFRQQFQFIVGPDDPLKPRINASVEALRKLKFPATLQEIDGLKSGIYPEKADVESLAIWADLLDRI